MKRTLLLSMTAFALAFGFVNLTPVKAHAAGKSATLNIATKGDELKFDKASMNAKAGSEVKLTFKNGASKTSGLQHNWVLVKPGQLDAVAQASMNAGADKNWIAEGPDVVAHTKLVNAGEKETITFTAPSEPGDYPYMCTFPGHYTTMKGILHVKK
jgi:uncharacterized protein